MRSFLAVFLLLTGFYFLVAFSVFAQNLPRLQILSPAESEVISGDQVVVRFQVSNFSFRDFRKTDLPKQNEGHLHLWLDEANQTAENALKHASQEPYLLTNLSSGDHGLTLELVHSDHSSFAPKISQTVNFRAFGTSPTPSPTPAKTAAASFGQVAAGLVIGISAIAGFFWFSTRPKK